MYFFPQRIQQFMSKFLKNKGRTIFMVAGLLCGYASAQDSNCTYAAQKETRPTGVLATVKSKDLVSYFLRGGAYVNVVSWSCRRLGKRLLIVVPASNDSQKFVETILTTVTEKEIVGAFRSTLEKAAGKYGVTKADLKIDGYEGVSIEVQKDEYESKYVVTYYTAD